MATVMAEAESGTGWREGTGWRAVGASMLALALGPSAIIIMCFGVFLPALHAEFGWPVARIALGGSISSVAIMLLAPVQGWLTDRFGGRRVVLAFLPLWAAGLAAMALLPADIRIFYLACFLLPFIGLGVWPVAYMKVVTGWFDRHLGIALGMTNVGLSLGAVALPLILGALFLHVGWRAAYLVLALAVLLLVWPVAALWLRDGDRDRVVAESGARPAPLGIDFREALGTRAFWIMLLSFPIVGAVSTGLLVHQSSILMAAGIGQGAAIAMQAATGVGSTVARLAAGWLLDRLPVKIVAIGMFVVAAASCLLLASPQVARYAVLAALLVGVVIGSEFDVLGMMIRRYQGTRAFGRIYGIIFAVFQFGAALGAAALALGRTAGGSYAPALIALAALSIVGALLFVPLGAYRYGPSHGRETQA